MNLYLFTTMWTNQIPFVSTNQTPTLFTATIPLALIAFLTFILLRQHKKHLNNNSKKSSQSSSPKPLPEPNGSWPIIGHLKLLTDPNSVAHLTFSDLADIYGPIYKIRLGVRNVLVINTWELAKECLSTSSPVSKAFLTRPTTHAFELLGYSTAMFGLSPYGTYWRETRKIAALHLLSTHRLELMKPVRLSQFKRAVKSLYDKWESSNGDGDEYYKLRVDLKEWLLDVFLNGVLEIIAGKSLKLWENDENPGRYLEVVKEFMNLAGTFTIGDAIPILKFMDYVRGYAKAMKDNSRELDYYTSLMLEDHKRERGLPGWKNKNQGSDFFHVMLDYIENNPDIENLGYDKDTIVKATCLTLILAAGETSSVVLTWGFALLLNHPHILQKAQTEIDTIIGKERQLTESDIPNLHYTHAIIKEFFRLYPAAPLSVPRKAIHDVHINGYHIPSNTWLYVNLHKIQRDPRVWKNPDEFNPDRFLEDDNKNVDFNGLHFQFIPFSSGRRMCPGVPFTMQGVYFLFATMIHSFEISSDEVIDMKVGKGISNVKATPVNAILKPRLKRHLY